MKKQRFQGLLTLAKNKDANRVFQSAGGQASSHCRLTKLIGDERDVDAQRRQSSSQKNCTKRAIGLSHLRSSAMGKVPRNG